MKEIREFLEALTEARSLADVNIAGGSALHGVWKAARRVGIVLAVALVVTTAALGQAYTRLDHKLRQADQQHRTMLTEITRTTKKQQRVMVARIVKANQARERLAIEVSHLRSQPVLAPQTAPMLARPPLSQPGNAVVVQTSPAPPAASLPTAILTEESASQPAPPAPVAPPSPPPPPPPVRPAPPAPPVAGVEPPVAGTVGPVIGPEEPPVGEPVDAEPRSDPDLPVTELGTP